MPSFNPFTSVTGRHAYTLFEIRLENDFIVFRGNEHESSGQLLKGTVVLCLPSSLKIEDIHLRLTGTLQYNWTDTKVTPTGISSQKVDRTSTIFSHRWTPFAGIGAPDGSPNSSATATHTKGVILPAGNYEWPFELLLPGQTTESVEGMREASITYKLKATVARGKLAYDLHAYKRLRIIRTLESSALEFLHAMSVENIWPNKVEYSIVIPQKAVVFGSSIPLETRFTPLLKGLELGDITIRLLEVHDILLQSHAAHSVREHKKEKEIASWTIPMSRDEHWQDMIEDTGQEGWVMGTALDLPRKLGKCLQDVNAQGIKIRHKLKLVVALKNPDGHISELRATLPVTIFISPNMPLDEDGNLVRQLPQGTSSEEVAAIAPPGYGEHVLDQLYEGIEPTGLQTPHPQSGMGSPLYGHSRSGSAENLGSLAHNMGVTPAALSSRLQSMSLEASHRSHSYTSVSSLGGLSGANTPRHPPGEAPTSAPSRVPPSAPLSRQNSDDQESSGSSTPEHLDFPEISELSKVPSYQTAVKAPIRHTTYNSSLELPDYATATTAPGSPETSPALSVEENAGVIDPLTSIAEAEEPVPHGAAANNGRRRPMGHRRRQLSRSLFPHAFHPEERRRLELMRTRERVV
ncbi:hypothetical protein B0T26DRAFT_654179 [Lasiosphaeria miniovina]|uniref:Arrestin C-terminal-like domain-containing protein n=1 Tax=Lasiosphaeria miniovina TaxID=1954250 RepID=A0AA40DQJ1_9PEZI|nr:uncharacterized protein B0T26DRAFT_654179 [Lasiosphaeria miniovina]KAK0709776.1 hypothetical protein B0T26DRAFT_654179 [Lasiosphaeria miniovina]